ncbi:disintegrin and metalloproteinase domain-containing protein 10-like [Pseudonaja textilis]|uniref:disintegrin and metalloproteinase domain-containing protein 10-like n=1 Tax=Pseudonaja textilis TaxID=8673 RepID=UPI000EA88908|nr:disintegrin and metalloproteinase domain-containing protein 10-like [Pseudonaja textilis]XP_026581422.1 disintegrin and metalloproteinase domain-containing protein 10-like [Pseudonaja textilis]
MASLGQGETCTRTSSKIWDPVFNSSDIPLLPGSPCGDKKGYCDKFHTCRFIDEDGPIARVKNFILDFIEMEDPAGWMKTHWCVILLVVLTLAAMMAGTVFLFGRTVSSKPDEPFTRISPKALQRKKQHNSLHWEKEAYVEMHQKRLRSGPADLC